MPKSVLSPITANHRSPEGSIGYEPPLKLTLASPMPGALNRRARRKPPCRRWLAETSIVGPGTGVGTGVGAGVDSGVGTGLGVAMRVGRGVRSTVGDGESAGEGFAASPPPQATATARVSRQAIRKVERTKLCYRACRHVGEPAAFPTEYFVCLRASS